MARARSLLVAALASVAGIACALSFDRELADYHNQRWREFAEARARFSAEDGVSKEEAQLLAEGFFNWNVSGCGSLDPVVDSGSTWTSRVWIGVAPISEHPHPIVIDKTTGDVYYKLVGTTSAHAVLDHAEHRLRALRDEFATGEEEADGR